MWERLKIWTFNYRTWIYSTQYMFYSVLLLLLVMLIDLRYLPIQAYLPHIFFTSVSLAKVALAALAGAQLTITTFTFSTILSVMSNYASAYSPRVIENFVKQKITMKVLGIFVGGFFYSITSLIFMRDILEEERVIAGFIGVVYAILSIFYFLIFVQKVIHSIQPTNLIGEIFDETLAVIEEEFLKRKEDFAEPMIQTENADPISATCGGYLSLIDFEQIDEALSESGGTFVATCKIGDFVTAGERIGYCLIPKGQFSKEGQEKIATAFLIQDNKVVLNDYRYGITKLVEIGLRAISPGINDPNTAIHCIRKLSVLLSRLAQFSEVPTVRKKLEHAEIIYTYHSFYENLYETFQPIVHYGKEDLSVMRALLEGLRLIGDSAQGKNRQLVYESAKEWYARSIPRQENRMDRRYLEEIMETFREVSPEQDEGQSSNLNHYARSVKS